MHPPGSQVVDSLGDRHCQLGEVRLMGPDMMAMMSLTTSNLINHVSFNEQEKQAKSKHKNDQQCYWSPNVG